MRSRSTYLPTLFDKLTALAMAGAASVACGGSTSGSGSKIDPAAFPEAICDAGLYHAVHGLKLTAVDYVALRQESSPSTPGGPISTIDQEGTACASAKDRLACGGALDNLRSEAGFPQPQNGLRPTVEYLATTAADKVSAVDSQTGLLALLAPIDNAKKAALVLSLSGHGISCDVSKARNAPGGGYDVVVVDGGVCAASYTIVEHVAPDGTITELEREQKTPPPSGPCATGRRPDGLVATRSRFDLDLGSFFAEVAHLEAASVTAFARLARELSAHGAPARLVRLASRAAKDEIRHARTMTRLARRFGGEPRAPRIAKARRRSLEAIARENAVEGCVRETFGALLATWQARAAADPGVRAAMRGIARDETAHAELSWSLAHWIEPRLSRAARARVEAARRAAIRELEQEVSRGVAVAIHRAAGMPTPADARTLFDGVRAELWLDTAA